MSSIEDIIPCIEKLSNTETVTLTYEMIQACDEEPVSSCRAPFIKKYHHFTYPRAGVVHCKYIKGQGEYQEELMKQVQYKGMKLFSHVVSHFQVPRLALFKVLPPRTSVTSATKITMMMRNGLGFNVKLVTNGCIVIALVWVTV